MRRVLCPLAQNRQRAFARCLFHKTQCFMEKLYQRAGLLLFPPRPQGGGLLLQRPDFAQLCQRFFHVGGYHGLRRVKTGAQGPDDPGLVRVCF